MKKNDDHIVQEIIKRCGSTSDKVIPILQEIQKEFKYLPEKILEKICEQTEITQSQITGVSTFYSQFRHEPSGKHLIKVCIGTACHVKGALPVYDAFRRHLKLEDNTDTSADRIFTIEKVACLGCCTLAPVVQIDSVTYGKVNQKDISTIVTNFLQSKSEIAESDNSFVRLNKVSGEIRLGLGSCCVASGSEEVKNTLIQTLKETGINTKIKHVGCVGMCYQVPILEVIAENQQPVLYGKVKPEDVKGIVLKHFTPQSFVNRFKNKIFHQLNQFYNKQNISSPEKCFLDLKEKPVEDFLNKQVHISTQLKGVLNPLDFDEYKSNNGFNALQNCLLNYSPQDIIQQIKNSGLRGRGGAGYSTGAKWEIVQSQKSDEKYIICNGDEGDPGAFMDRMILESFPYRVIEGMIIAAFAVGAKKGIFYIRAEYPLALVRIRETLSVCSMQGILGDKILNTDFSFHIEIFEGAGAFVCGEETALIASIEGKRGMPRLRPHFPAQSGLFRKPTLVNNVETFATIAWIINNGSDKFSHIGTDFSKGTKVFALAGKVARGGLIEVPMGTTIREIVEEIGGGIAENKKFKAVQIGGPSGGCIPEALADTPVDYQYLNNVGAMMGSGGLVVLDETDCMVDMAKYFITFTQSQSCGKCVFCRVGTKHMLNILENITSGKGKLEDIEKLEDLAIKITKGSLCGLGTSAPNPVLTSLKYFREEYIAHIEGKCPAKKCKNLITYEINNACIGCTKCSQDCPTGAIAFIPYEIHKIEQKKCIKCDICKQVCPVNAVDIN